MKYVFSVGFLIVFFVSITWLLPNSTDTACILKRDFTDSQYIGIVKEKYIDSSNHSYPIINILDSKDSIMTLNLALERSGLFDKMELNQSIYKPRGNDTVFLVITGKHTAIGQADFACD